VNTKQLCRLAENLDSRDFVRKCGDYKLTWAPVDDEIRHLCEVRRPGHEAFADVYPKVVIVDGAYRAGLSRCLTDSRDERFDAQREVACWICGDGRQTVESSTGAVNLSSAPDSASFLSRCLAAHGAITCELMKLGDSGKYPGSFVSKYLHFHNKDFVIYDGVADARLTKLLASVGGLAGDRDIARPDPLTYYEPYYNYLSRFLYLLEAGKSLKPDVTIKQLDHFLWKAWA
jgi:hypothetical protein